MAGLARLPSPSANELGKRLLQTDHLPPIDFAEIGVKPRGSCRCTGNVRLEGNPALLETLRRT